MDAKEKAAELFSQYEYILTFANGSVHRSVIIKCALIACEQLNKSECEGCGKYHNMTFWQAVIQELNKLN